MKISVIGCGRWGSFICWYLDRIGHQLMLYGRETSQHFNTFRKSRTNGMVTFSEKVYLTTSLEETVTSEVIIISVNSQGLRALMQELAVYDLSGKIIVLCMKGIEIDTGARLSEIVAEYTNEQVKCAVWLGPGHVEEFCAGIPNCMVIDSADNETKHILVDSFSGDLIRFYYGTDLIGNEVGAAAKNVIGIAAGMLDGLKLSSLKGALMSRATREVARLICAMGGSEFSAYGLCHLGDYEATVFSKYSHNRRFGEGIILGERYNELAEGYYTAKAIMALADRYRVELPICSAVYRVLYENAVPAQALDELFARSLKNEF
ncbi:MAG: NAD(P)H-dependent glycerol-3-phosphate dehydrogenase [Clostridia bacterium]|nr:NAD(P)H-dependent glycerol-3-phosphate dehydrogenase [Clostridia bacterium]